MALDDFIKKLNDDGRTEREMTRQEIIQCLDIIADDIMQGKQKIYHAHILLGIRHGLMTIPEQISDYAKNVGEATRK